MTILGLPEEASAEYLEQELASTEKALAETERLQQLRLENRNDEPSFQNKQPKDPLVIQLAKLGQTVESLSLAQDITKCLAEFSTVSVEIGDNIFTYAGLCHGLSRVLLRHPNILEICAPLYEEYYLPLYLYLYETLIVALRQELQRVRYPKGSKLLIQDLENSSESTFAQACGWLTRLEQSHNEVIQVIEERMLDEGVPIVVQKLFQPIVERVRFHFVEPSRDRATTSRIDRLPEWILTYLRENVLEDGGPYDLVLFGLCRYVLDDNSLAIWFLNELVALIKWVLTERKFFRHPEIAGQRSNPLLLCNAMEQFLLFDRTLQESAPINSDRQSWMGLMDVLTLPDKELSNWWMERERESVFSILFENDIMGNVPKPLANHVSPRAEIFCALIRSVQYKASVLVAPGPYLRKVAVPLCSQFVEALSDTSTHLRNLLCNPQRHLMVESQLVSNLHEWIELINGTHLAARVLLREGAWQDGMPSTSQSDHDLARFGRSLERLVQVLVEEFAASFVETVLMERYKLANYLMLAHHLLGSEEWDGDDGDLSAELKDTRTVLAQFHQVCSSILSIDDEEGEPSPDQQIAHYAPAAMREHVMNRLADKFLDVVLDIHDMTPDLWQHGSKIFAADVRVIFGTSIAELPVVQRLLDIIELLSVDSNAAQTLFIALGGLVGASTVLDVHDFSSDETLYEEAVSMIKAKGYLHLDIKDVISVLNRRRD